jgi:hypothetical protein
VLAVEKTQGMLFGPDPAPFLVNAGLGIFVLKNLNIFRRNIPILFSPGGCFDPPVKALTERAICPVFRFRKVPSFSTG